MPHGTSFPEESGGLCGHVYFSGLAVCQLSANTGDLRQITRDKICRILYRIKYDAREKHSIPKGDTLQKLAIYFGVTTDYLLGNVSDPFFYLDNERIIREINSYSDDDHKTEKRITVASSKLHENGRCIAADRVEELTEIPRYRREEAPEPGPPTPDTPLPADAPEGPETGK